MEARRTLHYAGLPAGSVLLAQGLLLGAALAFVGERVRTRIYVDGLNHYCGALKGLSMA